MRLIAIYIIVWYYQTYMHDKMIELFVDVCQMHVRSSSFGEEEKKNLENRIQVFEKKYKSPEEFQYSKIFKLCDDINYMTAQVSAHDLEIIALRLIELRMHKQLIESLFLIVILISCV